MNTSGLSDEQLNKILDKSKTDILLGKKASFFGSLLCSLEVVWSDSVRYAATDGTCLYFNADWWLTLPMPTRRFVLMHELEHVARLHMLRCGGRDMHIWVRACDAVINQFLIRDGESIDQIEWIILMPEYADMAEEHVYDLMMKEHGQNPQDDKEDEHDLDALIAANSGKANKVISAVIRATQQSKLYGKGEDIPAYVSELVQKFMTPSIPWETVLYEWCSEFIRGSLSWKRPNRRFPSMYMPSKDKKTATLQHLIYFFDTSASITDEMVMRFNAEVQYIKETLNPKLLTLVQFDTDIRDVRSFDESEPFEITSVSGRGNTSLECVKAYIEKAKPTAAIIFSDMECDPMPKPEGDTPIIWAVLNDPHIQIPYGKIVHISA
jgi:predicted metal-dependent peptidase